MADERIVARRRRATCWLSLGIALALLPGLPAFAVTLVPGDIVALVTDGGGLQVTRVDATTGTHEVISSGGLLVAGPEVGVTVTQDASIIVSSFDRIIRIDPITGGQTELVPQYSLGSISDVDVGPDGRLVALSSQFVEVLPGVFSERIRTWNIDPLTGAADYFAEMATIYADVRVAALAGGDAYFTEADLGIMLADASTGTMSIPSITLGGMPFMDIDSRGIVLNPDGTLTVSVNTSTSTYHALYDIDPATWTAMLIDDSTDWGSLAIALDGTLLATAGHLYALDAGGPTLVSNSHAFYDIAVVPIPEPSTAVLVGLGCLGLALRRR